MSMQKGIDPSGGHPEIELADIEQALLGDPAALERIYDRCARDIYRYAYSRLGSAADAADLAAQTFMAVVEALPRCPHQGHFSAWFLRIAHSEITDHFRRQKRSPMDIPLDAAFSGVGLGGDPAYRQLSALLGALDEDEREWIRLRYVVQLSFIEIAAVLGCDEQAVRESLDEILERLHSQMEAGMTDPLPPAELEEMIKAISNVPEPEPAFVQELRSRFVFQGVSAAEQASTPRSQILLPLKLALVIGLIAVVLYLAASPPVVAAFQRLLRYIPGIGVDGG